MLIEVTDNNGIHILPACATPIMDGMKVFAQSVIKVVSVNCKTLL